MLAIHQPETAGATLEPETGRAPLRARRNGKEPSMHDPIALLTERLRSAGITDVVSIDPVTGGLAATAGIAWRAGGRIDLRQGVRRAAGRRFRDRGGGSRRLANTRGRRDARRALAGRDLLVLSASERQADSEVFWEQLAHALARLHTSTVPPAVPAGIATTGWAAVGRSTPGTRRRIRVLRTTPAAALARRTRVGGARRRGPVCAGEPVRTPARDSPDRPACLTHGDLWAQNVAERSRTGSPR